MSSHQRQVMSPNNADSHRRVMVVITGAGGGIGGAIAKTLAEQQQQQQGSYCDFILCDVAAGPLEEVQRQLRGAASCRSISTIVGDVTEAEFPGQIIGALDGRQVDVLVAAHGVSPVMGNGPRLFDINYTSVRGLVEGVQRHMARGGAVVFIGSMSAYFHANAVVDWGVRAWVRGGWSAAVWLLSRGAATAYLVSKRCVQLYAQAKAAELRAAAGVRIVSVSPGLTAMAMGAAMSQPWILARFLGPMGRMATPPEIAAVVAFFASPAAAYCSGMDVLVDGGVVASLTFPLVVDEDGKKQE